MRIANLKGEAPKNSSHNLKVLNEDDEEKAIQNALLNVEEFVDDHSEWAVPE